MLGAGALLLVQPGVLDRDARGAGERKDHSLVVVVEGPAVLTVAQVDVAVDPAPDGDGDAEQGMHRGVAGREAGGLRVVGDLGDAQRLRVVDEVAQQPPAARQLHP